MGIVRARDDSCNNAGSWRHVKILLKPDNPAFGTIELTTDDEGTVEVVAEVVEVLG